ncbi:TlpA disulfide reductase family protein [uncultured Algibacter sp.]|uniref:TlpA disulfide reductase family protein n=1 Tax=uncultured Algibacter sp. TaxID=298659 RepID=UPI00261D37D2|nr:TlpA disulfide reductase family protein [uncultured Algibacter sp.]
MKQLIIFIFLAVVLACQAPKRTDSYVIQASAPGVYNGMRAYLKVPNERGQMVNKDTAIVLDEKFSFEGVQTEPVLEYLFINGSEGFLPLIVENGDIAITIKKDSLGSSEITGTSNNEIYKAYNLKQIKLTNKIKKLSDDYRNANINNSSDKQTIYESINNIRTEANDLLLTFAKEHKDSDISVILLNEAIKTKSAELEPIESTFAGLSEELKTSTYGQKINNFIETQKRIKELEKATQIGSVAPNFSAKTPEGATLALNDIKGKVTLIDFWASWCGPCRRENPNVVKVYNEYHDKGLEIISVSLDRNGQKDRWLKAIKDDKMNWHHISNLQFWQDPIAKMYGVRGIPATFLLDAEGKIVAKNLRGPALKNKVSELLD